MQRTREPAGGDRRGAAQPGGTTGPGGVVRALAIPSWTSKDQLLDKAGETLEYRRINA